MKQTDVELTLKVQKFEQYVLFKLLEYRIPYWAKYIGVDENGLITFFEEVPILVKYESRFEEDSVDLEQNHRMFFPEKASKSKYSICTMRITKEEMEMIGRAHLINLDHAQ
jgi:hypothetical protein